MFAGFEKYQRGRHRFILAVVRTPLLHVNAAPISTTISRAQILAALAMADQ